MNYRHPAFHALIVRPETANRVDTEEICDKSDQSKRRDNNGQLVPSRRVLPVAIHEDEPESKSQFNDYAEKECLAGDKWKEHAVGDNERKYRNNEQKCDDRVLQKRI